MPGMSWKKIRGLNALPVRLPRQNQPEKPTKLPILLRHDDDYITFL